LTATTYKTLADKAEGIYKDKGSKFLAFGFPVSSEDKIREILDDLRKKHHGARHHCYAYRIGNDIFRMNDDGEPSNTAGKPIYSQLLAGNLTNILVVVVRYFGGILLGKGGLIKAYRSATINMLQNAEIIIKTFSRLYKIDFKFGVSEDVFSIIKEEKLDITEKNVDLDCYVVARIPIDKEKMLAGRFKRINDVKITALE